MNLFVGIGLFVGGCLFMFVVIVIWGVVIASREAITMRIEQRIREMRMTRNEQSFSDAYDEVSKEMKDD